MLTFSTADGPPLMAHQEMGVAKLLPSRVGALFMDMGTGKSRALIELARLRAGKIDRVVWFTPVSLKETVRQEILKHTDVPEEEICVFGNKESEVNLPLGARFVIVGIESMGSSARVVLAVNLLVTESTFVVVDESSYIKGHRALRTKRITEIGRRARYRAVLTGTPFSQGVVDLYSQMAFLSPKILGYASFWSFSNNHLEYETRKVNGKEVRTNRIVASHNKDVLAKKIAPYVFQVTKEECLDLPDKIHVDRHCLMTREQRDAHDQAKREFLLELDPNDWLPIALFKLFTVLQTIACGFWNRVDNITGEAVTVDIKHNRLDLLAAVLGEVPDGERVIIWTKYLRPAGQIVGMLEREHGAGCAVRYDGTLDEKQRNSGLLRWRAGDSRFLVATQSSGGHGLTLVESAYSVFYADGWKYSERIQAEDRTHRIGATRRPTYISLNCAGSIDGRISAALARKGNALAGFIQEVEKAKKAGMKQKALDIVRGL
jgi:SNF2 family DNA or RNA helicase